MFKYLSHVQNSASVVNNKLQHFVVGKFEIEAKDIVQLIFFGPFFILFICMNGVAINLDMDFLTFEFHKVTCSFKAHQNVSIIPELMNANRQSTVLNYTRSYRF